MSLTAVKFSIWKTLRNVSKRWKVERNKKSNFKNVETLLLNNKCQHSNWFTQFTDKKTHFLLSFAFSLFCFSFFDPHLSLTQYHSNLQAVLTEHLSCNLTIGQAAQAPYPPIVPCYDVPQSSVDTKRKRKGRQRPPTSHLSPTWSGGVHFACLCYPEVRSV